MSAVVVALLGVVIVTAPAAAQISGQVSGDVSVQNATPRDRVPPPLVGTSSLRGRVIDAVTGAPIARARVRIQGIGSQQRPSVLTDGSGRFAFGNLPAGPYGLVVDKSTYMPGHYPEGGRTIRSNMKPFVLTEGQLVENITVSMYHGASISGRVVDAYGDPFEFATVRAMRLTPGRPPAVISQGSPNDLGEFRLPRLQPGDYVILVAPSRVMRSGPEEPIVDGQPPAQPLPTYFPSALAIDQAQPITVARGESITGIEIALSETTTATIVGSVVTSDGQPVTTGYVNARMMVKGVPEGVSDASGTSVRPDGTFRMQLAPGDYTIDVRVNQPFVNGQPPRPDTERFGSARVSLAPATVENVTVVVGLGATATGRVIFEGATPAPPVPKQPIYLPFSNGDGQNCRANQPQVGPDWTFKVDGLRGTCTGVQSTVFGRWTLKAVMYGDDNLVDRSITFEQGQSLRDVQVVFTDKRTELTFQVSDDRGQLTREYVSIVFPVDKARWMQGNRFPRTYSPPSQELLASRMPVGSSNAAVPPQSLLDQMRRETMSALPAGDYYVIAVDDIEGDASRDPRILEQLMSSATRVTVSEEAPSQATLRRFKLSEIVR